MADPEMLLKKFLNARCLGMNSFQDSAKSHSFTVCCVPIEMKLDHPLPATFEPLRLLPPFAGALREKNRTRASFNKILTNYISVESLINVLYEKNTILAMFSFIMCQEAFLH